MTLDRDEARAQWAAAKPTPVDMDTPPSFTVPPKAARPKGAQKVGNETSAAAALEVLVGFNTAISMVLMGCMMPQAALGVSAYEPTFREQAYAALLTDPGLCARILKMSSTSGTLGLLLAYTGMALTVAPVALTEKSNLQGFLATRKKGKNAGS